MPRVSAASVIDIVDAGVFVRIGLIVMVVSRFRWVSPLVC
jgi:hypothetical protein